MTYTDTYHDLYGGGGSGTTGVASVDVQVAWDDVPLEYAPTWSSIKQYVKAITITRGGPPDQQTVDTSVLTLTLDDGPLRGDPAGRFNPMVTTGPWYGKLTSYRQIRVVATDSTGTQRIRFRGHVQPRGWANSPQLPGTSEATVTASDILQMAARFDLPTLLAPDFNNQTLKARLISVMVASGLPADWYTYLGFLDGTILGPTTFGPGKLLSYLQQMALSDGGIVFCNRDGVIVLEQRLNPYDDVTRTEVQAVFDDTDPDAIKFETIGPDYAQDIVNVARMAGRTGNVQTYGDGTNEAISGLANTDEHDDLYVRDDTEAYARAVYDVQLHSSEQYGPIALTFEVQESDVALDAALNLDLRYRVAVNYTPPGLTDQFGNELFVAQIVDNIPIEASPNSWKCSLMFAPCAPADALGGADFLRWDVSEWDNSTWGV